MKTNIFLTGLLLSFILSLLLLYKGISLGNKKQEQGGIKQFNEKKIALRMQNSDLHKIIFVRASN